MLAVVLSYGLIGIEGFEVRAEVNLSPGLAQVDLSDCLMRRSENRVSA